MMHAIIVSSGSHSHDALPWPTGEGHHPLEARGEGKGWLLLRARGQAAVRHPHQGSQQDPPQGMQLREGTGHASLAAGTCREGRRPTSWTPPSPSQTKKILQLLRLRQINNGIFLRVSAEGGQGSSGCMEGRPCSREELHASSRA
jgi:hypothetical protein